MTYETEVDIGLVCKQRVIKVQQLSLGKKRRVGGLAL